MKLLLTIGPDPNVVLGFFVAVLLIVCGTYTVLQRRKIKFLHDRVKDYKAETESLKQELENLKVNITS